MACKNTTPINEKIAKTLPKKKIRFGKIRKAKKLGVFC